MSFTITNPKPVIFGKRNTPPILPRFRVWCPLFEKRNGVILTAQNSFEARKEFADYHGVDINQVHCYQL